VLSIPDDRRRSSVSNISSITPSPGQDDIHLQVARTVSPETDIDRHTESVPSYSSVAASKEAEAANERADNESSHETQEGLPLYSTYADGNQRQGRSLSRPNAQIVSAVDLSDKRPDMAISNIHRPFSFFGTESLTAPQRGQSTPLPFQDVESERSKTVRRDTDQLRRDNESDLSRKQSSRSYSRPFGGDENMTKHAAYPPQDHLPLDRGQVYATENPLPSARRPTEDINKWREQTLAAQPIREEEEHYRIPGPYGQEYRSPKQVFIPFDEREQAQPPQQQPTENGVIQQTQSNQEQSTENALGQQSHMPAAKSPDPYQSPPALQQPTMNPPPVPDTERPRSRTLGGLFASRSKSRSNISRDEPYDEVDAYSKRNSIFRRNSRNDSLTSQKSSLHESRDQIGRLPSSDNINRSKRRLSRDMLRSNTSSPVHTKEVSSQQQEGKKTRFSGLGNFFKGTSKTTGKLQRASTLPLDSGYDERPNQPQQQQPRPVIMPGTWPSQQRLDSYQQERPGFQQPGAGDNQPRGSSPLNNHHNQARQHLPTPQDYRPQPSPRPSDLRINTSNDNAAARSALPNTAPVNSSSYHNPLTQTSRDIPYASPITAKPYSPSLPHKPASTATVVPRSATSPAPHVADLHKRSRSPRLGRRASSDEDLTAPQADPANTLGTFSNKKISPAGGVPRPENDQETPYRIDLPSDGTESRKSRLVKQALIERANMKKTTGPNSPNQSRHTPTTVADRMMGPHKEREQRSVSPMRRGASAANGNGRAVRSRNDGFVAELPGSKANGYESDESPMMSATAYPGQEWMPVWDGRDD